MRLALPTALAFSLFGLVAAHATPVTFKIAGYINTDPTQTVSVTGMTTLDLYTSNPSVLSINLTFAGGRTESGIGTQGQDGGHNVYVGVDNDLFSFTDDLHNYTANGGTFNLKDQGNNYVGQVFNGTLTPVDPPSAVTPEPSTLALLGTGLVGMLGAARRRFA